MAECFRFEVSTPYRRFFREEVEAATMTIADGEITIYAHHSFFAAPVKSCVLRIKNRNGAWKTAFVTEGIVEVKNQSTILMVDAAEWPDEIERERAIAAKQKAEETIRTRTFKFESSDAEAALRRAEFRLKVKDGV